MTLLFVIVASPCTCSDAAVRDRGLAPHEHAVHGVAADLGAADRGLPLGLHDDPVLPAVLDDAVLDLRDAMHNHASQSGVVYP